MNPIDDIRLDPHDTDPSHSWLQHEPNRWRVRGLILEGAWATDHGILAATSDNVPYEDALHISLCTPDRRVEHLTFGAAYTTGMFRLIRAGGNTLEFTFWNDTVWQVTVLGKSVNHIPYFSDPRGVSRSWRLRTRLQIGPSVPA